MQEKNNFTLSNAAAERACLAGVLRYGSEAYYDVVDIVNNDSFCIDSNQMIWSCVDKLMKEDDKRKLDASSIYSVGETLGYGHILSKRTEAQHLQALLSYPIELSNIRKFGAQIRKLQIARQLTSRLELAKEKLLDITGTEKISDILGIAENAVFDFGSSLGDKQEGPVLMGEGAVAYVKDLIANPVDLVGISSGIEGYDIAIGGGFRKGSVSVIGARAKTCKSILCDYIGSYVSESNIPVLYLDTEMSRHEHVNRILGSKSEVITNDIEKGKFGTSPALSKRVIDSAQKLEKIPFYHTNVAGMMIEDIVSIIRRWIVKTVGLDDNGHAKPCLIIYDYLKLMDMADAHNFAEHQILGFSMMSIHNFSTKYQVPILMFCQLNRDGMTKEDISAFAGSDRIAWFCSSLSMVKEKSDEEVAEDGLDNGTLKMMTFLSRHGEGLAYGDYVNLTFHKKFTKIVPGKTKSQTRRKQVDNNFEIITQEEDVPFK